MVEQTKVTDVNGLRARATSDGRLDTQVRTGSGAWVRVHSLSAPEAEAKTLVDHALKGRRVPPVVAILGVGLGYAIDELERRRPDVRIVALELAPTFVDGWDRRRDWSDLLRHGQLVVGVAPLYELSTPAPAWPPEAIEETPLVLVHPVIGKHNPGLLDRAHKTFQQFLREQRANAEARRRLAGLYLCHTIENLPILASATDVGAIDGIAVGQTVVLCGAGPSLDWLLPSLLAERDRVWLVALDTALRPLMRAGIVPDIVVAIDPTPLNGRHLIDLPTRVRPWLVAETSLDPRAFAAFSGRIFACRLGQADPWPWLETLGLAASRLRVWGSVLTAACDLVSRLQALRIVFAGMDLAFTNDQCYCRGTAFEEDWLAQQQRDNLPSIEAVWRVRIDEHDTEEPDLNGRAVRTSPQMVAFRNWVRTLVASMPTREFINASEAGILHGSGIAQVKLADVLGSLPRAWAPDSVLRAAARPSFAAGAARLRSALETVAVADPNIDRDAASPIRTWAEVVPDFDEDRVRRLLEHAARRLRAQEGATAMSTATEITTETDWIDVPYDASNFFAKAPLEWHVSRSGVVTYAYHVDRKTMTLAFKINGSRLAGGPANELYLRIPGNYLPARGMANPIWMASLVSKECGYATVHAGLDIVLLFRGTEDYFNVEVGGELFVFGQLTFEVQ